MLSTEPSCDKKNEVAILLAGNQTAYYIIEKVPGQSTIANQTQRLMLYQVQINKWNFYSGVWLV